MKRHNIDVKMSRIHRPKKNFRLAWLRWRCSGDCNNTILLTKIRVAVLR
jgi:hypothetical protein